MSLTSRVVQLTKPREKTFLLTDGRGLNLIIYPDGRKGWRYRYYRPNGKRNMISLGSFPDVSLASARIKVSEMRQLLQKGIDPAEQRKKKKEKLHQHYQNTFLKLAQEWHENASKRWKTSSKRAKLSWSALEHHVFPFVGNHPISEITPLKWIEVLKKLEAQGKHEQKRRIHSFCRDIYRLAIVTNRATINPLTDIHVALNKAPASKSFAHVAPAELPSLFRAVSQYSGNLIVRCALLLQWYTAVRPGELRWARWEEINVKDAIWTIPPERMKMGKRHFVPLPEQAVTVLTTLQRMTGRYPLLFPGRNTSLKPISDMTLGMAYKRLGYTGRHVPHGTRHVIATELREQGYPRDWVEAQLAHKVPGVEGIYTHAVYMAPNQRPNMMQEWADFLEGFLSKQT